MIIFNIRVDVTEGFTNGTYLHYFIFLLQTITNYLFIVLAIKSFPFTRNPNKMPVFHPQQPILLSLHKLLPIAIIFHLFSISANDWFLILFYTAVYFTSHFALLATRDFSTLWIRDRAETHPHVMH